MMTSENAKLHYHVLEVRARLMMNTEAAKNLFSFDLNYWGNDVYGSDAVD